MFYLLRCTEKEILCKHRKNGQRFYVVPPCSGIDIPNEDREGTYKFLKIVIYRVWLPGNGSHIMSQGKPIMSQGKPIGTLTYQNFQLNNELLLISRNSPQNFHFLNKLRHRGVIYMFWFEFLNSNILTQVCSAIPWEKNPQNERW